MICGMGQFWAAILLTSIVMISSASAQRSVFEPGKLWLDTDGTYINAHGGGILAQDGVYYWFGEFKVAGGAGNRAHVGVSCYSSSNLHDWKNEGIALHVSEDPKSDIANGCILERPKVIYNEKTKKFVMWFHLERRGEGYGSAMSGVAVSDHVTGPYEFLKAFRPNAGIWPDKAPDDQKKPLDDSEAHSKSLAHALVFRRDFAGGQMARDMTLFVDDDGHAYHIYASEENFTMQISLLSDDYLSQAGKYIRIFVDRSNEAPAMFKHGGKYWLITSGCTGWNPNAARLGVADSIWGPWKELPNPCTGPDANLTFHGQSTFVLPVQGKPDAFIFMADKWNPRNAIDGRYLWLPIQFKDDGVPSVPWMDTWDLSVFK
jgi:hypothetical protein